MSAWTLCANISMLFAEAPFLDRIDAAARAGFEGVECWFPYEVPSAVLRRRLSDAQIRLVMINTPPGEADRGEFGLAALPGAEARFGAGLDQALDYAAAAGADRVHVMAGHPGSDVSPERARATYLENLTHAAEAAADGSPTLVIEAINPISRPGYFLASIDQAAGILRDLARPRVRLLYDHFHALMMGPAPDLAPLADLIAHVQVASAPARAEPDQLASLLPALGAIGYAGWISGEYQPAAGTAEGLAWMAEARALMSPRVCQG